MNKPKTSSEWWGSLLVVGVAVAVTAKFWSMIVLDIPIGFWGIALDSPVMSLSHAINIDYWLTGPDKRIVSQPQTYHPGLFYQIASFVVYRIAFSDAGDDWEQRLVSALTDPSPYWEILQHLPICLTATTFVALFLFNSRARPTVIALAILSFFTLTSSFRFGIYDLFNESFALPLAAMFFTSNNYFWKNYLREESVFKYSLILSLVIAILYLNKMNLVLYSIAVLPILFFRAIRSKLKESDVIAFCIIVIGSAIFVLIGALALFGSIDGVKQMFGHHIALVAYSGHYGSGERNIIDTVKFIEAITTLWHSERPFLLTFLFCTLAALIRAIIARGKDKSIFYEGITISCALVLSLLAVLKHYIPYYLVVVAAIFPFAVTYAFSEQGGRVVEKVMLVFLLVLVIRWNIAGANSQLNSRASEAIYAEAVLKDEEEIKNDFKLNSGETRFWMYRIIAKTFQRNFIVEFTSSPRFQRYLTALQGCEYQFSPWSDDVIYDAEWTKLSKIKPTYLVVDTDGMKYVNEKIHGYWMRSDDFGYRDYRKLRIYYAK